MAKNATFEIDPDVGVIALAAGSLFLGELCPVTFSGYSPASGNELFLSLFAADHKTPLADNNSDAAVLDLRYEAMRAAFGPCRSARDFYAAVIERNASTKASTSQVIAAGHVSVIWSPVVFNAVTGSPATLKGDKGEDGEDGADGTDGTDGTNGTNGTDGRDGERGPQGLQGVKGDDGAPGVSPTVSVSAVSGGHRVVVVDAQGSHSFDVMDGAKGETGATGATGPQGAKGDKGDKGDQGQQGIQGPQGERGAPGEKGDSGVSAEWVTAEDTTQFSQWTPSSWQPGGDGRLSGQPTYSDGTWSWTMHVVDEDEEEIGVVSCSADGAADATSLDFSYFTASRSRLSRSARGFEKFSNKATSISSASTDEQYPAAKAVFEFGTSAVVFVPSANAVLADGAMNVVNATASNYSLRLPAMPFGKMGALSIMVKVAAGEGIGYFSVNCPSGATMKRFKITEDVSMSPPASGANVYLFDFMFFIHHFDGDTGSPVYYVFSAQKKGAEA